MKWRLVRKGRKTIDYNGTNGEITTMENNIR